MKLHFAATLLFIIFVYHNGLSQSPKTIILDMVQSSGKLKGFTAEITKEERIDGDLVKQVTAVKLIRRPYQLYLNQRYPKKGVEILCRLGENKALINPNAFPWFNLNLDPYGSLMRRGQHHTVYDSGFDLMSSILHRELARIGNDTATHIYYKGIVDWQGRPAYHIEMDNPDYQYTTYHVQLGEDLNSIAKKLNINEYAILEINEDIDFYDEVSPGQALQVPSSYAKKMILYIDQAYMLPLVIKVFDGKGLYEQYAYKNFILNPTFHDGEFTSEYKDYGF
jgi:outer membrane lipoprotein-sorting protein